jgi:hypothetical protein
MRTLIGMTYSWVRATFLLALVPLLPIIPRPVLNLLLRGPR